MSSDLNSMDIGELRKTAAAYNITAQRTWKTEDYIRAIDGKRKTSAIVEVAEEGSAIPPGHARIKILATDENRHPVIANVNNYPVSVPRDVEVNIPLEVLEVLNNASRPRSKKVKDLDAPGGTRWELYEQPTHHIQVFGMTPGVAKYKNGKRKIVPSMNEEKYRLREKFKEVYGKWPSRAEFGKWKEQHMVEAFKKSSLAEDKDTEYAEMAKIDTPSE